ncbi:vWA domain-containing protein [Maricaulis sp. D1M11]|uniref:vWA domain-containing protein n=1 Tax=Maricaulis sp. D1M11 TaxID=3076117 RepID=UPI0039B376C9
MSRSMRAFTALSSLTLLAALGGAAIAHQDETVSASGISKDELERVPRACRAAYVRRHSTVAMDSWQARREADVILGEVQPEPEGGERITVTGSRVRGAQPSSPPPPSPPPPPPPHVERAAASPVGRAPAPVTFYSPSVEPGVDRERYEDVTPHPVQRVSEAPVSTFSIDVDTASYAVVRRYLNDCELPPSDAVRIEEMVNYFDYAYTRPDDADTPFAADVTVTPTPWNAATRLMHIGIQGYDLPETDRPRANLVFLIDVSGSMNAPDKLPLAIEALEMLVEELEPEDTVSIVVYAGAAGAVLEPTEARHADRIEDALGRLRAGGSTAGGAGLALAYQFAEQNFDPDAVNRVMLLTDGDFNVGVTQDERLEDFVARKRDTGIYLSVMGFGRGNYNDQMMQAIAQSGNGIAAYIDSEAEARRFFVEESFSSLFPIAEDVKIQVEFNPAQVAEYRLIGYETRALEREDFNNDAVDAGEVGSGHSVTAIYEIAAPGSDGVLTDPLRYQPEPAVLPDLSGEIAHLRLRYKAPGEDDSQLLDMPITTDSVVGDVRQAPLDIRFALDVVGLAQILRGDPYLGADYGFDDILASQAGRNAPDPYGYREEFYSLVAQADWALRLSETPPGTPHTPGQPPAPVPLPTPEPSPR